ncbi:hypothetical protein [Virgibacillus ihumii]|uniref:hypothetical protein n=1 Tax=Virgibacillus ihumii TaxID=2686091 RepID=UPI00157D9F01|nr:hypothetical protein [Virgibacillus ihumii]
MILMIFIYAIFVPVTVFEWLSGTAGFPLTALVVGTALPVMRTNHISQIQEKYGKTSS